MGVEVELPNGSVGEWVQWEMAAVTIKEVTITKRHGTKGTRADTI